MDYDKTGEIIKKFRKEKGYSQEELATLLNVSNKTVSKWECGLGFPDSSILSDLSKKLELDIDKVLNGELKQNSPDVGNMEKIKFYLCGSCNNILTSTSNASIHCCGKKLEPLKMVDGNNQFSFEIKEIDMEYYIEFNHEMAKEHYISFVALVDKDIVILKKLYAESEHSLRMPYIHKGSSIYFYCIKDGMYKYKI